MLGAVVAAAPRTTSQMASARANCGDVLERRKAGLSARVTLMARGMGPGNAAAQAVATRAWSFPWNRSQHDAQRPGRPAGRAAARRNAPTCARCSRIQQLYVPAIDASGAELSTDVRVDYVLSTAIPSYQQSKSSGAKLGSESARCKVRNATPTGAIRIGS